MTANSGFDFEATAKQARLNPDLLREALRDANDGRSQRNIVGDYVVQAVCVLESYGAEKDAILHGLILALTQVGEILHEHGCRYYDEEGRITTVPETLRVLLPKVPDVIESVGGSGRDKT